MKEKIIIKEEDNIYFLDNSFWYEVIYMLDAGKIIIAGLGRSSDHVRASFLLHIRILNEFFYEHRDKNGNLQDKNDKKCPAWAIDYNGWKEKTKPSDIQEGIENLNIFLAHPSYHRNRSDLSNEFPVFLFYNHFKGLALKFLEEIDEKYLTKKLRELKELLKTN